MGGKCSLGMLTDNFIAASPQYPVVWQPPDPFKLCDFPLVTLISLLY